jgi:cytosine/adenosine deaminase-related metal-dependent hydrolase
MFLKKGVIAVGSDADLAIIDPSIKKHLTRDDFTSATTAHGRGGGVWLAGDGVLTVGTGDGGRLAGTLGDGQLVTPRKIDGAVLGRAAC